MHYTELVNLLVVGLTGGIGSGKSSFCAAFSLLGVPIIDADIIAHDLSQPYSTANTTVKKLFGEQSLRADGTLNREWIRSAIFNDDVKKKQLEAIFHPLILQALKLHIKQLENSCAYCIIAVPLLFEQKSFHELTQFSIAIDCTENEQITRVMHRSSLSETQVRKIIDAQMSRSQRNKLADLVINNEDGLENIADKVSQLHKFLLEKT